MKKSLNFYEKIADLNQTVPSSKNFGLIMGTILIVITFFLNLQNKFLITFLLVLGFFFIALALLNAKLLNKPNRLWIQLGNSLSLIINPITMLIIYIICISPIAIIMKLKKYDPMQRTLDRNAKSYWIKRKHNTLDNKMENQF